MEIGDRSNLELPVSSHRLPTISASQALQKLIEPGGHWVTTGLLSLDKALRGPSSTSSISLASSLGGYSKGQITEIYGPPAAGKTALALQAAAEAISRGSHVVWIDANKPFYYPRLLMHLASDVDHEDILARFHHYQTLTLPHLLALICHPPLQFPPSKTTLLILDGISSLFTSTYPENPIDLAKSRKKGEDAMWLANRRYAVMADFLSKLTKLAAVRDLAVVMISQTSLKVRTEFGAILKPALSTKGWIEGIQNRVIVFRDFFHGEDGARRKGVRFAAAVKVNGVSRTQIEHAVPFRIETDGCRELKSDATVPSDPPLPTPRISPQKRKRKRGEIADSQSDDSDEHFLDDFDLGQSNEDDEVVELHVSYAQPSALESGLADFETAMEAGLEEI